MAKTIASSMQQRQVDGTKKPEKQKQQPRMSPISYVIASLNLSLNK